MPVPRPDVAAVRYARRNRVPAVLLLFALIVGITIARSGPPSGRRTAGFLIASIVVVALASVEPEFTVAIVGAALVAVALGNVDVIVNAANRFQTLFGADGATGAAGGLYTRAREG